MGIFVSTRFALNICRISCLSFVSDIDPILSLLIFAAQAIVIERFLSLMLVRLHTTKLYRVTTTVRIAS